MVNIVVGVVDVYMEVRKGVGVAVVVGVVAVTVVAVEVAEGVGERQC